MLRLRRTYRRHTRRPLRTWSLQQLQQPRLSLAASNLPLPYLQAMPWVGAAAVRGTGTRPPLWPTEPKPTPSGSSATRTSRPLRRAAMSSRTRAQSSRPFERRELREAKHYSNQHISHWAQPFNSYSLRHTFLGGFRRTKSSRKEQLCKSNRASFFASLKIMSSPIE
jgi:hypothetical protein